MRRVSAWWVIGPVAGLLAGLLVAAFEGWLGPLVVCGADAAPVCVAWPAAASAGMWLLFLGFFVGLAAWQVREWRRDPMPALDASEVGLDTAEVEAPVTPAEPAIAAPTARPGRPG